MRVCALCVFFFFSGGEGPRCKERVLARAVFPPSRVHHSFPGVLAISSLAIGHGAVAG